MGYVLLVYVCVSISHPTGVFDSPDGVEGDVFTLGERQESEQLVEERGKEVDESAHVNRMETLQHINTGHCHHTQEQRENSMSFPGFFQASKLPSINKIQAKTKSC